jgi:hypothetical protein
MKVISRTYYDNAENHVRIIAVDSDGYYWLFMDVMQDGIHDTWDRVREVHCRSLDELFNHLRDEMLFMMRTY